MKINKISLLYLIVVFCISPTMKVSLANLVLGRGIAKTCINMGHMEM